MWMCSIFSCLTPSSSLCFAGASSSSFYFFDDTAFTTGCSSSSELSETSYFTYFFEVTVLVTSAEELLEAATVAFLVSLPVFELLSVAATGILGFSSVVRGAVSYDSIVSEMGAAAIASSSSLRELALDGITGLAYAAVVAFFFVSLTP